MPTDSFGLSGDHGTGEGIGRVGTVDPRGRIAGIRRIGLQCRILGTAETAQRIGDGRIVEGDTC